MRTVAAVFVILTAIGLTACGGSGDTAPPEHSSQPAANESSATALVTSSPAATYSAGTGEAAIYSRLNAVRLAAGVGALTQAATIDVAAGAHLGYLAANAPAWGHSETAGLPGYYADTPAARMQRAGYTGAATGEVLAGTASTAEPVDCIDTLLDSVYHAAALMRGFRDVGIAYGSTQPGIAGCVLDLGAHDGATMQLPPVGTVSSYPYSGQTGVTTAFTPANEVPNPAPDLGGQVGQPVYASMYDVGALATPTYTVTSFALKDAADNTVPARLLVSAQAQLGAGVTATIDPAGLLWAGEFVLVPLSPLLSGATYTAVFTGTAGTTNYSKTWSFTTK